MLGKNYPLLEGEPVLLLCVPYAPLERPSIGISILKAALEQRGIGCRVFYANLMFAEIVGLHPYDLISRADSHHLIGEWTFRSAAFPKAPPVEEGYFTHIEEGLQGLERILSKMGSHVSMRELIERVAMCTIDYIHTIAQAIVSARPRIVGCSSTFQQHMASLALLRAIKTLDPSIITELGGANCESEMGVITHRENPWVDYVVSGEGEEAFPLLCEALLTGNIPTCEGDLPQGVIGPIHRAGGQEVYERLLQHPPRAIITDLDRSPIPNYDDYFNALATSQIGDRIEPGLLIETSRGCWWGAVSNCTFCGLNGEGMGFRYKSPQRAIDEFRILADRYQVPRIYAVDNIIPMNYLNTVIPALAEAGNQNHIFYETKANLTREQLEKLALANIRWIQPGLESFNDQILKMMGKGTTARQNIQLLKWCRELGINVYWLLLYDFPGENDDAYVEMGKWLSQLAHLQPPRALMFVQYIRFSPYQRNPTSYNIDMEAEKSYDWLYLWSKNSINNFAYYFDDYTAERDRIEFHHERPMRRPGLQTIRSVFLEWSAQWPNAGLDGRESMATLYMEDYNEKLIVTDTRKCRSAETHILTGLSRAICLACHVALTERKLHRQVKTDFGIEATYMAVEKVLSELIEKKLLLKLESYYISLPLLGKPQPLPSWVHQPAGRIISIPEYIIGKNLKMLQEISILYSQGLSFVSL